MGIETTWHGRMASLNSDDNVGEGKDSCEDKAGL